MSDCEQKKFGIKNVFTRIVLKLKNKKFIELSVCAILGLVIVAVFLSSCSSFTSSKKSSSSVSGNVEKSANSVLSYSQELEHKLENVIGSCKGVENVKVVVVCESTPIITLAEQTETKTTNSGTNEIVSKYPVYEENGSTKTPMILYETAPKVTGVLVVAKGAGNASIKLKLVSAIETLLGIDASKIDVLEGE